MVLPPRREKRRERERAEGLADPLFEALRARRRDLAKEQSVPPYVIFHDATLREMAALRPRDLRAMGGISGVGQRKLDAYGAAFLEVIQAA